jgi:uncharacterized protein (DUF2141 family)
MSFKSFISAVVIISIVVINIVSGSGCASIVPPEGGKRDSLPPRITKANPSDSSRNVKDKTITLSFDEFVDVQNAQQEILISPIPKNFPNVDYKLNTVTVKLKDSLEANTTYSLNFGNSIKDINEGNVLKNYTYVFSTGPYIDSLEFSGKVILAETGKTDTTLIVMLHSNSDDSAVVKEKPRYVTRLNGKGEFTFKNLPPKTFYVYALKDNGGSRTYNEQDLFAFADSAVAIGQADSVTLYAYTSKQETQPTRTTSSPGLGNRGRTNPATDRRLKYTTSLTGGQQDLLNEFAITFEQPLRSFDSTKLTLFTDTTYSPATAYRFVKDSSNTKLQLVHTWKENTTYNLILDKDFAEDTTGKKLLKTDTLTFRTKKLTDYAKLKLKFRNLDMAKNPVLLFVLNNAVVKSFPLSSADFSQSIFLPGEYELRILHDTNKNGTWDPGEFFGKRKQPELVMPVERKITVKAGLDNDFEIAL